MTHTHICSITKVFYQKGHKRSLCVCVFMCVRVCACLCAFEWHNSSPRAKRLREKKNNQSIDSRLILFFKDVTKFCSYEISYFIDPFTEICSPCKLSMIKQSKNYCSFLFSIKRDCNYGNNPTFLEFP